MSREEASRFNPSNSDENEYAYMDILTKHVKLKRLLEGKNPSKVGE